MFLNSSGFRIPLSWIVPFFTRVVLGLRPSPALLGAVIIHHLDKYMYGIVQPQLIKGIKTALYVDDLDTGSDNVPSAFQIYSKAKQVI